MFGEAKGLCHGAGNSRKRRYEPKVSRIRDAARGYHVAIGRRKEGRVERETAILHKRLWETLARQFTIIFGLACLIKQMPPSRSVAPNRTEHSNVITCRLTAISDHASDLNSRIVTNASWPPPFSSEPRLRLTNGKNIVGPCGVGKSGSAPPLPSSTMWECWRMPARSRAARRCTCATGIRTKTPR